ncbi:MAG: TIGR03118 family protein [Verrucomicrobia bacterium]|nr:TIGR03118 family protein [Verrucomicrobiota bacterium]MBV9276110.1 TIGR03118 family protein [Verrucomicrobiota bacterium]
MKKRASILSGFTRWIVFVFGYTTLLPLGGFAQQYQETDLVSNSSQEKVVTVDPNLIDPWGIARSSTGPWWVSDKGKGVSTIYNGSGQPAPPVLVTVPSAGQAPTGSPTGIVFNGGLDFAVAPGKGAIFIFATFDGTIAAWNPQVNPAVAIQKHKAPPRSVFSGATIALNKENRFLYVTDVHEGKVRVFDTNFSPVEVPSDVFRDTDLPENFVPFNIQNIGGNLYVAFAKRNAAKNFVDLGRNLGAVDVFSPRGELLQRLERGPFLNAPWGLVQAPSDFGAFSHSILVGQFGSGQILAFDVVTGRFQGKLEDQNGQVIQKPGLWGIAFGAGNSNSGGANALFFNVGTDQGAGGLFGSLTPVAADLVQGNDQ